MTSIATKRLLRTSFLMITTVIGVSMTQVAIANTGMTPPELKNKAYVLMDYDTGVILAQKNADMPLPPASLTKMMTSYIFEQKLLNGEIKEDTPIKMSESAWCRGDNKQSCMYVELNANAQAIDMLRGIIIQSGNDASKAVAEYISGSEPAFATLMNEEAKKLGMTNTVFINSTGMPALNHKSSAKDLAILAKAIITNSGKYYPIYSEKEFTYNNIKQGNRNTLLSDPTVDGLKTGHTEESGFSLAASAKRNNMRLIAIVLGADSMNARAEQTRQLLDFGFGNFENVLKAPKGEFVIKAPIKFGKINEVELVTANDLKVLTTKAQSHKLTTITQLNADITAPIKEGQELGRLAAVMDGNVVASVPIVATSSVEQVNFVSRLWRSLVAWFGDLF